MPRTKSTVCVAHIKDVDGLASAALVKMATGSSVALADYGDLIDILSKIESGNEVFVCDLGMNETISKGFVSEIKRLSKECNVTYIDHHPLPPSLREEINNAGAYIINSPSECSGVLTYWHLRKKLPRRAALLACYAAVTDYMDDGPKAQEFIGGFDRQYILMEATILAFAIAYSGGNENFLSRVVDSLADMKPPHQIEGVVEFAQRHAEKMNELLSTIGRTGRSYGKFAYAESEEHSLGHVANLLIGEFQVPVGVALRRDPKNGLSEVSMRAHFKDKHHLGGIAGRIAKKLGGAGGGHAKASGLRIPTLRIPQFLELLKQELDL